MTTTQVPIIPGPRGRLDAMRTLATDEALVLQGFPVTHSLPPAFGDAYKALGNSVHPLVVKALVRHWLYP